MHVNEEFAARFRWFSVTRRIELALTTEGREAENINTLAVDGRSH